MKWHSTWFKLKKKGASTVIDRSSTVCLISLLFIDHIHRYLSIESIVVLLFRFWFSFVYSSILGSTYPNSQTYRTVFNLVFFPFPERETPRWRWQCWIQKHTVINTAAHVLWLASSALLSFHYRAKDWLTSHNCRCKWRNINYSIPPINEPHVAHQLLR